MKQEIKLQTELEQITSRVVEMQARHSQLSGNLAALQDNWVSNKATFEELANATTELQTTTNALRLVEGRRDALQKAITEANESDRRNEQLQLAKAKAIETEKAFNDYIDAWTELDEAINRIGNKLFDSFAEYRDKGNEFRSIFNSIDGNRLDEIEAIGLSDKTRRIASGEGLELPQVQFANQIRELEILISNQRQEIARSKKQNG